MPQFRPGDVFVFYYAGEREGVPEQRGARRITGSARAGHQPVVSPPVDVTQIEEALGRLEEGLSEARMAAEMMAEGDVSAVGDLNAVIDAMALEIAELKGRTSGGTG